jgi:RNA polymerase-interacting CarD/CdnL/TRCF family regulator
MDELGVRLVMSSGMLIQVLGTLRSVPSTLSSNYKERQEGVQEKLGTGLPVPMAETVRDLTWHRKRRHLTQRDEALLNRGRERLAAEMALATDADVLEAHEMIDGTLSAALARGFDELEAV